MLLYIYVSDLRPLEPDAKQFEVHDTEVGDGEGEEVDWSADGAHLTVRQHDKVEAVCHRPGDDDRQETQPDGVEDRTQPRVHRRVVMPPAVITRVLVHLRPSPQLYE